MKATKVSAADLELFHQATRLVKPMPNNKRHYSSSQKKVSDPKLKAKRTNAEGLDKPNAYLNFSDVLDSSATVFLMKPVQNMFK